MQSDAFSTFNRWLLFIGVIIAGLALAHHYDLISTLIQSDASYLSVAILAFFLFFAFRHWTMVVLVALPIMLYDEWYQYIVLHAHYETYYSFNDVMCDVLGLAVGLLLLAILGFYPERRRLHAIEWVYLAALSLSSLYLAWLWHKGILIGYQADELLHTRFVFNQLLNPTQLWQIHSYTYKEYMVLKPIMGVSVVLGSCFALCLAGLFFRERSL